MTKCQLDDLIYRFMETYMFHSRLLTDEQLQQETQLDLQIKAELGVGYNGFGNWANKQYKLKGTA